MVAQLLPAAEINPSRLCGKLQSTKGTNGNCLVFTCQGTGLVVIIEGFDTAAANLKLLSEDKPIREMNLRVHFGRIIGIKRRS